MGFSFILSLVGALFGANPLKTATDALLAAHRDSLTAANEHDKLEASLRIDLAEKQLAFTQQAVQVRMATAGDPLQRFLAFIAGLTPIVHYAAIGIGTTFAAPLGWTWLDWTLHIPPFPEPMASWEGPIILSYFGLVGAVQGLKVVAGAISLRRGE